MGSQLLDGEILITDASGRYALDLQAMHRVAAAYQRSALLQQAKKKRIEDPPDTSWFQGVVNDYLLPDVYCLDVDWPKLRSESQAYANEAVGRLSRQLSGNIAGKNVIPGVIQRLLDYQVMTNANMNQYKKRQQQISRESMHNVNESIDSIDRHILAAKVVRDSAATTLMIGSVVLSGGAAAAAIGGNAMVSGAKKYAETERIHDAVISAGTEIVFARVKFGKGVGGELLLAFAKSGVENGALWAANDFGDMAKGKTALYETVRDAAVDVAVGELLNTRLVRQGIVKAAFPLHKQMRVEMRQATGLLRGKSVTFGNGSAATKMLKSLPQAALKAGGKKAIDYSVSQITAKDATPVRQSIPYWENSRQAVGIRKLQ